MKLGVSGLNSNASAGPAELTELAVLAEQLGYESWWASDHVVLPSPQVPPSPADPKLPLLDPLVSLSYVAAVTERMLLGTAIVILPQRNPLVLAKQTATLDVLSRGRARLGVGAGYLEPEMTAVGVPYAERGARTDEYIDAMRALWTQQTPSYQGKHVSFDGVDAHPRPVRPEGVPILVGGHSPGAFRRVLTRAHGWIGIGTVAEIEGHLGTIRKLAQRVERPTELGELEITVLPMQPGGLTAQDVPRYADLGVQRLLLYPTADSVTELAQDLRHGIELVS